MKTYLARQPLFNNKKEVVGYELLFRQNRINKAAVIDDYQATLKVIKDLLVHFGLQKITNSKRAFVKFNSQLILDGVPDFFKAEKLVIELSAIDFDNKELIEKIKDYKEKGYLIAYDQFENMEDSIPILNLVDIVKLNFSKFEKKDLHRFTIALKSFKKVIIAEKLEDEESYRLAKSLACTMFQGYFFQKPKMFESKEAAVLPSVYFEMLEVLGRKEVDYDKLADIIKKDSAMTLAILKLMNSVIYHTSKKITSVKEALVRAGVEESRRVILINMLKSVSTEEGSKELLIMSLRRGKIAEWISDYVGMKDRCDELFMVGLLSLINILMRQQMQEVLTDVPLHEDIINALLGSHNALSDVLEIIILNEMGEDQEVEEKLSKIGCSNESYNKLYLEASIWADKVMGVD